jgi:hypothetical protein
MMRYNGKMQAEAKELVAHALATTKLRENVVSVKATRRHIKVLRYIMDALEEVEARR